MSELVAVYVDFQDPHSYRVWRWLSLLPERERVEVRPYSLDTEHGERLSVWDRTVPTWSLELLALGELARTAGPRTHAAFVDGAFAAVHERDQDPSSPETFLALASTVGLDLDAFSSDGERWRAEVGLWHREAEDELGVDGVPCLVFPHGVTLLMRLQDDVADTDAARRLLFDLEDLATQPVTEVRRTA